MRAQGKTFLKYVSLNVLGMIGLSCYILADTFFIAQAEGEAGLAALNYCIVVFSLMQGTGLMLGIGGATRYAVRREQEPHERCAAFMHTLFAGAVCGALFGIVGVFFSAPIAAALGADAQTLPLAKVYLTTVLCFAPVFLANNILLAFVRNDGDPRLSMFALLASSLSNVLLDYLFLFPGGMGMFGAAFATGLSPLLSMAVLATHFLRRKNGFAAGKCRLHVRVIGNIFSLGFSAFVGEAAAAISLAVFNGIVGGLAGNTGVAAYGIVANVSIVVASVFTGVGQGVQPLASRLYGAGARAPLRQICRYACVCTGLAAAILYAAVFLLTGPIVAAFNAEQSEYLRQIAEPAVRIYFVGYFFAGFNLVAAALLSAVSRPGRAMIVALLRSCVLSVPLVFLLSSAGGLPGVWLSFPVTEGAVLCVSAVFLGQSFRRDARGERGGPMSRSGREAGQS